MYDRLKYALADAELNTTVHHHHPAESHPVETILKYRFKDRKLLEEALTHSSAVGRPSSASSSSSKMQSCTISSSSSYQRMEFVGDAALGLAVANYLWLRYPSLDACDLSLLRSANVSTEKLARVAVRRQLYPYLRHDSVGLEQKIREFVTTVEEEDEDSVIYGGPIKAPKVLADIVESIAAAVYIDINFDLKYLWKIFSVLLEPLVTLEKLQERPQPITALFELCQKQGKQLHFEHSRNESTNISTVRINVDGKAVGTGVSEAKATAKLTAAREALKSLGAGKILPSRRRYRDVGEFEINEERNEIVEAKKVLYDVCGRKKWLKPVYGLESEQGPYHDRRFTYSVRVEVEEAILCMVGEARSRVKDAENSAASMMICSLLESGNLK